MAGFKAGGQQGFAQAEQVASLRHVLAANKIDGKVQDAIVATVKDSGLLNASATRQWLVKVGLLAEKIDPKIKAELEAMLA